MKYAAGGRSVLVCDQLGVVSVMHCLDDETIADEGFQRSYPQEAAALAGLGDPHVAVPRGYVVDAAGWIVASVRGHVDGASLAEVLSGRGRDFDVPTAAAVVKDVLTALAALHRGGIAHRRVAADQVVIGKGGIGILIHAGLAPRLGGDDLGAELAADLDAVGELFADCLGGRRPAARAGAHRGQSSTRQTGGMAEYLSALLTGAVFNQVPADERTASVLGVLDSAMYEHFGAGWEEHGRTVLAARGATARRTNARRAAVAGMQARSGFGFGARHATEGASHARAQRRRLVRYGGPLFAFTLVFTLVLAVASHASIWDGGLQASPSFAVRPHGTVSGMSPHGPASLPIYALQPSPGGHGHFVTASGGPTVRDEAAVLRHRTSAGRARSR